MQIKARFAYALDKNEGCCVKTFAAFFIWRNMEQSQYSRNKLIQTLMKIGHGKLDIYVEPGLLAAHAEPELLAHFIGWNSKNGKVRDSKVAFPALALRNVKKTDQDLAENAIANALMLSPRDVVRFYDFSKSLTAQGKTITGGFRRLLEQGIKRYLATREANIKWWDRTVLQHRAPMKKLYRIVGFKGTERAQKILFKGEYPGHSVFASVAKLKEMPAAEAASLILNKQIPLEVAIGAVSKAKDKDVVLALIEGMTGNQLITNTGFLQRLGCGTDPILKAAYDAAIERAKTCTKVESLKAGRAAETVTDQAMAAKLTNLQQVKTKQLGGIDGDWLVLADCSGSMASAIELGRKIAALITERVVGSVYLIFFNTAPTFIEVTGLSYDQILAKTNRIRADGGTAIGCGLDYLRAKGVAVQGIAIASDGGDNSAPLFHQAYAKYVQQMEIEPTAYLFHVIGERDALTGHCQASGIQLERFEMGSNVDYYSLPNIIGTMRTNRYSLVDEIMEFPLLTFDQVFKEVSQ